MNPIIKQELRCDLCDRIIFTPHTQIEGLNGVFVIITCPNSNCENNGILLIMQPPTVKRPVWEVIGKVLVPGSCAEVGSCAGGQERTSGGRK